MTEIRYELHFIHRAYLMIIIVSLVKLVLGNLPKISRDPLKFWDSWMSEHKRTQSRIHTEMRPRTVKMYIPPFESTTTGNATVAEAVGSFVARNDKRFWIIRGRRVSCHENLQPKMQWSWRKLFEWARVRQDEARRGYYTRIKKVGQDSKSPSTISSPIPHMLVVGWFPWYSHVTRFLTTIFLRTHTFRRVVSHVSLCCYRVKDFVKYFYSSSRQTCI